MAGAAAVLVALSMVASKWPRVVAMPLAFFGVWTAISLLIRVYKLRKAGPAPRAAELPGGEISGRLFERGDGRREPLEKLEGAATTVAARRD
jgi:hypothetical protein